MNLKLITVVYSVGVSILTDGRSPLSIIFSSTVGGRSHCKGLLEIGNELAKRGHKVSYAAQSDNIPYADGHELINKVNLGHPGLFEEDLKPGTRKILAKYRGTKLASKFQERLIHLLESAYEIEFLPLLKFVDESKPDVLVCDLLAAACQDIAKLRGIPLILGSQAYDYMGLVSNPYISKTKSYGPLLTKELNFFERIKDFIGNPYEESLYLKKITEAISRKRLQFGVPDNGSYLGDTNYGMVVSVSFMGLEVAQAIPPNVKVLGPIKTSNNSVLPKDASDFLSTHNSVVYAGFGTNSVLNTKEITNILEAVLKSMELGIIDGLIWGLSRTPKVNFPTTVTANGHTYDVQSLLDGKNDNFLFYDWAPQESILQHKSTKLTINHAGQESISEAISTGVPIIAIPFFFDQPRNARKVEMANIGKAIQATSISSQQILDAIVEIIEDSTSKYYNNTKKMQVLFQVQTRTLSYASETIEDYTYLAKLCRPIFPDSRIPCELHHLLPQLSSSPIIASGADVYLVLGALAFLFITFSGYIILKWFTIQPNPKIKKN